LAKVLHSGTDLLLLDAANNHLDVLYINILAQTLERYVGTSLSVSYDRHFVAEVANEIWYIEDKQIGIPPLQV
jgi:ATP-binding cassette, subfamily F, member 3